MLLRRQDRSVTSERAAGARDQLWRHEEDPRFGSRYGRWIVTCGWSDEEEPAQASETQQKTRCHPTSHQKTTSLHSTNIWARSSFGAAGMGIAIHDAKASDRALRMPSVRSLADVSRPVLPSVCLTMRILPCRLGFNVSCSGWFSG